MSQPFRSPSLSYCNSVDTSHSAATWLLPALHHHSGGWEAHRSTLRPLVARRRSSPHPLHQSACQQKPLGSLVDHGGPSQASGAWDTSVRSPVTLPFAPRSTTPGDVPGCYSSHTPHREHCRDLFSMASHFIFVKLYTAPCKGPEETQSCS